MMKYEMEHYRLEWQSAQDCAGPLSHCLLLPEKKEKEERGVKGKKQLTVKNNYDKLRFFDSFSSIWKLKELSDALDGSTWGLGIHTSLSSV